MEDWSYIEECIETEIQKIFKLYPMHTMSDYERRKSIFDYLTKRIIYDDAKLQELKDAELNKTPVRRNPKEELLSVVDFQFGICNGISQYYKLLLERIGIESHCVIVDDGTEINHQLVVVYNNESNSYSFDDVTSVVVGKGTQEEYFDYDVEQANRLGQGNKPVFEEQKFFILPEEYINFVVGRTQSPTPTLQQLPENVKPVNKKGNSK